MSGHDDEQQTDEVWRDIVANYGERPRLDASDLAPGAAAPASRPVDVPSGDEPDPGESDAAEAVGHAERFRPPSPPPVPWPRTWQRAVAWAGVVVFPALAVLLALTGLQVPPTLGWILVLWCVGGFVYLAVIAPRLPRDPWDDGSRV